MKIDIAFDIDSVLVDPMPVFRKVIKERYNGKIIKHDSWHIYTDPDLTLDEFLDCFQEVYERYEEMPILPGARRLLKHLSRACPDDPINFITARRLETAVVTHKLINERLAPNSLYTLSFAREYDKTKYMHHHHYMIEDRAKNALSLAQNDIVVYLPDQPWNQEYNHPELKDHPYINRIKGVIELLPDWRKFVR